MAGAASSTLSMAAGSSTRPVRAPSGPRRNSPPAGSGVSGPMPAAARARLLHKAECPEMCRRNNGCSGTRASSSARLKWRFSARPVSSYPAQSSHSPLGVSTAPALMRPASSARVFRLPMGAAKASRYRALYMPARI